MTIDHTNLGEAVLAKLASLHALSENIRIITGCDGDGEALGARPHADLTGLRADLDDWPTIGVILGALAAEADSLVLSTSDNGSLSVVSTVRGGIVTHMNGRHPLGTNLALALLALPEAAQ